MLLSSEIATNMVSERNADFTPSVMNVAGMWFQTVADIV
jgi:hypothetical protein